MSNSSKESGALGAASDRMVKAHAVCLNVVQESLARKGDASRDRVQKYLQTDDVDLLILDHLRSAREVQHIVLSHGVKDVVAHHPQALLPAKYGRRC